MTHAPETGAMHKSTPFFWRRFLVRVSSKSGTGFVWYQIPAPITTLFYSKPESSVHVTEMIVYDYDLFLFNLLLATMPPIRIALIIAYTSLSATFIFGARSFHSRSIWCEKPVPKTGAISRVDLRLRFLECVS